MTAHRRRAKRVQRGAWCVEWTCCACGELLATEGCHGHEAGDLAVRSELIWLRDLEELPVYGLDPKRVISRRQAPKLRSFRGKRLRSIDADSDVYVYCPRGGVCGVLQVLARGG